MRRKEKTEKGESTGRSNERDGSRVMYDGFGYNYARFNGVSRARYSMVPGIRNPAKLFHLGRQRRQRRFLFKPVTIASQQRRRSPISVRRTGPPGYPYLRPWDPPRERKCSHCEIEVETRFFSCRYATSLGRDLLPLLSSRRCPPGRAVAKRMREERRAPARNPVSLSETMQGRSGPSAHARRRPEAAVTCPANGCCI